MAATASFRFTSLNRLLSCGGRSLSWFARGFSTEGNQHTRSGKLQIGDLSLHYDDHGALSAPAVLCVPGALGSTMSDFKPQFDGLSKQCRVISIDLRGYGKSIPPNRDFPLDYFERDANDLKQGMEALGVNKYSVLGWSDGGMAGIILSALNKDSVENLVVWGSNCFVTDHDLDLLEATRDLNKWSERMRKPLEDMYGKERLQTTWSLFLEGFANIKKLREGGDICSSFLPLIECPTYVLHGMKDPIVPLSHAEFIANNVPGCKLHIYENGKHNLHLRYADEFNHFVLKDVLKLS